jgi:hypothetical protein
MTIIETYPNCFRPLITNPNVCRWWWPWWPPDDDRETPLCGKWDHQECPTEGLKPRADSDDDGYPD